MKKISLVVLFLLICSSAFGNSELEESLSKVQNEKKKVENYIKQGQGSAELEKILTNLEAEEKQILKKIEAVKASKLRKSKKVTKKKVKKPVVVKKIIPKSSLQKKPKNTYEEYSKMVEKLSFDEVIKKIVIATDYIEKLNSMTNSDFASKSYDEEIKVLKKKLEILLDRRNKMISQKMYKESDFDIPGISANISLVSDYIWRGQSQNNNSMAVQGGIDYAHENSGINLGTWVSSLNSGSEVDFYGGYNLNLFANISSSLGAVFYHYPKSGLSDTIEYFIGFNFMEDFDLKINYIDDYFGSTSSSWFFEFSKTISLNPTEGLFLKISAGFTTFEKQVLVGSNDYMAYGVELKKIYNSFEIFVKWSDTDRDLFDGTIRTNAHDNSYLMGVMRSF